MSSAAVDMEDDQELVDLTKDSDSDDAKLSNIQRWNSALNALLTADDPQAQSKAAAPRGGGGGAFAALAQEAKEKDFQKKVEDIHKKVSLHPWNKVLYFLNLLVQALELSADDCIARYRFWMFSTRYTKQASRHSYMPTPEQYLQSHCETFVRRITRHINWCMEKALLIVQFASVKGSIQRPLSMWEVISHSESLAQYLKLCVTVFFDVSVYKGRKYMPKNATEFEYSQYLKTQIYFGTVQSDLGEPVNPGPQTYPIRQEEAKRVQAFETLLNAYRTQPETIPSDVGDALRKFSAVPKVEEKEPSAGGFASLVKDEAPVVRSKKEISHAAYLALEQLLSLSPDASLDRGLAKTGYFIRLLRQATGTTGENTYIDDLDTEEMIDSNLGFHLSALIDRTRAMALSLIAVTTRLQSRLCPVTLKGKKPDEIIEWISRDRTRLVQGVQLVVYDYCQNLILSRRSAGISSGTARAIDGSKWEIELWFAYIFP